MFSRLTILLLFLSLGLTKLHAGSFERVILDPGHGGKDKGAIWGGITESSLNMKVARKVAILLKANGIPVTMTRRSDTFVSPTKRAELANRYHNVIFVSIHFNAYQDTRVTGLETYYASAKGKRIAKAIHRRLLKKLRIKDRKVRSGIRYAVLNKTRCPAVLVECGYMSNPAERKKCARSWYHSLVAGAIVDGIMASR